MRPVLNALNTPKFICLIVFSVKHNLKYLNISYPTQRRRHHLEDVAMRRVLSDFETQQNFLLVVHQKFCFASVQQNFLSAVHPKFLPCFRPTEFSVDCTPEFFWLPFPTNLHTPNSIPVYLINLGSTGFGDFYHNDKSRMLRTTPGSLFGQSSVLTKND